MMSKTDRTRPWRVQIADPLNNRFKYVGNPSWSQDGSSDHYWKKLVSCPCTMCSPKKTWQWEKRKKRTAWRKERAKLLAYGGREDD